MTAKKTAPKATTPPDKPSTVRKSAAAKPARTPSPRKKAASGSSAPPARVDLAAELGFFASSSELFNPAHDLFHMTSVPGLPRLAVAVGPNASGKSLLVRAFAARCATAGLLPFTVSMRIRAAADSYEMTGMRRTVMFGDDGTQSTGAGSVRVVRTAIERNLDRPQGSVLLLDEPELGLSQGYAAALGEYIGMSAAGLPDSCSGILVVTHSRVLVSGLLEGAGALPTFARLGGGPADVHDWLSQDERMSVEELLALPDVNAERFRRAQDSILSPRK